MNSFSTKDHHPLRERGRRVRPVSQGEVGFFSLTSSPAQPGISTHWEDGYREGHDPMPLIHDDLKLILSKVQLMSGLHVDFPGNATPPINQDDAGVPRNDKRNIGSDKVKACMKWLEDHASDPAISKRYIRWDIVFYSMVKYIALRDK